MYDSLALKALCSSQKVTKFQHQMALSLADHILKHQDTNKEGELLRQFQMLDMDGDGVISPKELETFFKHSKYENSVADLLRRADLDHDDRISYREVLVLALERVSWNVPLRREDLSRRVGLSSSDVDIAHRVQQQQRDSRRSPSRTSPRTNRNIQDAARRSSRRKQSIELTAKQSCNKRMIFYVANEQNGRKCLGRYGSIRCKDREISHSLQQSFEVQE